MGTLCTISQDIYRYTDASLSDKNILSVEVLPFPENFQLLELGHRTHHSVFKGIRDRHEFCSDSQSATQAPISLKHLSALLYKFRL
jgi:hypothetical protein